VLQMLMVILLCGFLLGFAINYRRNTRQLASIDGSSSTRCQDSARRYRARTPERSAVPATPPPTSHSIYQDEHPRLLSPRASPRWARPDASHARHDGGARPVQRPPWM